METEEKLAVLGAAAKYDLCASTSISQPRPTGQNTFGNRAPSGICHSYTPDGRCVSLLKVLMTNACKNNCRYCVNRASNDFQRVGFEPEELAKLFMELYRRNYLEGIFLSSAVQKSTAHTMEKMIKVLEILRYRYNYRGYAHLKALPHTPPHLIAAGARLADRMSVNLESPNSDRLKTIAPEKDFMLDLIEPITAIQKEIEQGHLKAGQTTQFVVGAAGESDRELLRTVNWLYRKKNLKRAYFSAFIPVSQTPLALAQPVPLVREHRLYQADWLMRFYGFSLEELALNHEGNLELDFDPKLVTAIKNREIFPVEINRAPLEILLKVPGIGPKTAKRLVVARQRHRFTSLAELKNVGVVTKRAKPFILINGRAQGKISSLTAVKQLPLFKAEPENQPAGQVGKFPAPGPFIFAGP